MMKNRLDIINKCISLLSPQTEQNIKNSHSNGIKIKKKFKLLKNYDYIEPENIQIGDLMRSVSNDLSKISALGVVISIKYYPSINDVKCIKYFFIKHLSKRRTYWKIKPQKYYLYITHKGTKSNFRDALLELLGKDIELYKKMKNERNT